MSVRESVEGLRSELGIEPADAALAPLYEAYLKRDTVSAKEGAALLVGLDPAAAPTGAGPFGAIEAALAEAAGTGTQISIDTLVRFAEVEAVMLPRACTDLYGFIKKTVLGAKISAEPPFAARAPQEGGDAMVTLLGAALNVVANFPSEARNAHGLVDPECIARVVEEKSVVWFGADELPFPRARIVEILDEWLK